MTDTTDIYGDTHSIIAATAHVIADTVRTAHEDGDSKSASEADLDVADAVLSLTVYDPGLTTIAAAWGDNLDRLREVVEEWVDHYPTRDRYDRCSWQRESAEGLVSALAGRARDELDERALDEA